MNNLRPCPFCSGPPVAFLRNGVGGGSLDLKSLEAPDGHFVTADVFCHECGAHGEEHSDICYDGGDAEELRRRAIASWNTRDTRHVDLFIANGGTL